MAATRRLNNSQRWLHMKEAEPWISIKCVLMYIYKTTRVQKSVHRQFFFPFFSFLFLRSICKFRSHNCSKRSLRRQRRGAGGRTITLLRYSSTDAVKQKQGNILADATHAQISAPFGFFRPSSPQQTHFVLHIVCCFAITTAECNSSLGFLPPRKCTFWQKVGTFKKTWAFYNNRLHLHVIFLFKSS